MTRTVIICCLHPWGRALWIVQGIRLRGSESHELAVDASHCSHTCESCLSLGTDSSSYWPGDNIVTLWIHLLTSHAENDLWARSEMKAENSKLLKVTSIELQCGSSIPHWKHLWSGFWAWNLGPTLAYTCTKKQNICCFISLAYWFYEMYA